MNRLGEWVIKIKMCSNSKSSSDIVIDTLINQFCFGAFLVLFRSIFSPHLIRSTIMSPDALTLVTQGNPHVDLGYATQNTLHLFWHHA